MMKHIRLLLVFSLILTVVNCSRSTPPSSDLTGAGLNPGAPSFNDLYTNIFSANYVQCHDANNTSTNGGIDFTSSASAYQTLMGTASGLSATHCDQVKIVNPGSPQTSYISAVLFADMDSNNFVQAGCKPYAVHHQDQNLSADERATLLGWIQMGAPNN